MKILTKYIIVFLLLIVGYIIFGLMAWHLPDKKIQDSIAISMGKGDIDIDYPRAIVNKEMCRMDNCTDALILNQTYNMRLMPPLRSVMLVPSHGGETRDVEALKSVVNGTEQPLQTYARYWHGSTFLMRFLTLLIGRYANIRLMMYYISSIAILLMLAMAYMHSSIRAAMSFVIAFLLLKGYVLQFSIQFFPVIMLACCGGIAAIKYKSVPHKMQVSMFVIGSLTSYFDLLTTPLLTLGIPALMYVACNEDKIASMNLKSIAMIFFMPILLWGIGYGGTWMAKWIIATCITPENVFAEAISVGHYRINGAVPQMGDYSILDTLMSNIQKMPMFLFIVLFVILSILATVFHRRVSIKNILVFVVIGLMPYLWYIVLSNHSWTHCWFTYRSQVIAIMAVVLILSSMVDWPRIQSLHRKKRNL